MSIWKAALVCTLAVLAPTLTVYTTDDAVAGGVAGHEVAHSTAGTIGSTVTGAVISHELSR